jgi:hypothetical protein
LKAQRWVRRLSLLSAQDQFFKDLLDWANGALLILSEATHLCDLDPGRVEGESFFARRHRIRIELSAAIDRGRWFFTNIRIKDHGEEKEIGYRGYRHEVLDGLVFAYQSVGKLDYSKRENNSSLRVEIAAAKRHFVGQIQNIIKPDSRSLEFNRIARDAGVG